MLHVKPQAYESAIAFTRLLHRLGVWNKLQHKTVAKWYDAIMGAY